MIVLTSKKHRIENGVDIEKYVGAYCGVYPDNITIDRLKNLSTKSLVKAYLHVKSNQDLTSYYRNLRYHLFLLLRERDNMVNGVLLYDFEDDSHLELAPDYLDQ